MAETKEIIDYLQSQRISAYKIAQDTSLGQTSVSRLMRLGIEANPQPSTISILKDYLIKHHGYIDKNSPMPSVRVEVKTLSEITATIFKLRDETDPIQKGKLAEMLLMDVTGLNDKMVKEMDRYTKLRELIKKTYNLNI